MFIGAARAVVGAKRPVDEQHVKAEEPEHRPGAGHQEHHSGDEARPGKHQHENEKPRPAERAVRGEDCRKNGSIRQRIGARVRIKPVVAIHGA